VIRALAFATIVLLGLAGCGYGEHVQYHVLDGPLNAIDVTLAGDKIAVLAGTREAKSVSIVANLVYGQELLRFPVSEYATSIRGGPGDTFLLGIGAKTPGARGAVEYWNVRGQMTATIPMPSTVVQLSKVDHGIVYALVADGEKRAAVPIDVDSSTTGGRVVPLPANVTSLDQCPLLGKRYLVTVGPSHRVQLVNALTNTVTTSSIELHGVSCIGADVLVGMGDELFGRSVRIVRLLKTAQHSEALQAPGDAVAAVPDADGRLLILRRMGASSEIQIWTHEDLTSISAVPASPQLVAPSKAFSRGRGGEHSFRKPLVAARGGTHPVQKRRPQVSNRGPQREPQIAVAVSFHREADLRVSRAGPSRRQCQLLYRQSYGPRADRLPCTE
jgi:hypothetical protein